MLLIEQQIKHGLIEGLIPTLAWDTACTSHSGIAGDLFKQTEHMFTNLFALTDGHPTPENTINMLEHKVIEPVRKVNMVLALANQYLLSGGKFLSQDICERAISKRSASKMAALLKLQCGPDLV